jgi:filamentous hemagglutinin family protein
MTSIKQLFAFLTVLSTSLPLAVAAQVVPDETLGSERSRVRRSTVRGREADLIEGGAARGRNLFHSFREFSIREGDAAYFANPAAIENIFSRVTGSNPSNIQGLLGVDGAANLFLMNPNGILFGPNASLDVQGSFVGTTANAIGFGDLGFFSATNPDVPSTLLTVNPSAFLFNQIPVGNIANLSIAPAGTQPSGNPEFGLRVGNGQSLVLLGGNVEMIGGRVNALGGRVELGGLAGVGSVGLTIDDDAFRLAFPRNVTLANLILDNNARVSVRGVGGGDIFVNANQFTATNGGRLVAGTESSNRGGDITVNANQVRLSGIGINGFESSINNQAIVPQATGTGDININAQSIRLDSGALITNFTNTLETGFTGNININTQTLSLDTGASINNQIGLQAGQTGDINIQASDAVTLAGQSAIFTNAIGDSTDSTPTPTVSSGNVVISTDNLTLRDNSSVSAISNLSLGSAGKITIRARESIRLADSGIESQGTGGSAGDILFETNRLVSQVSETTEQIRSVVSDPRQLLSTIPVDQQGPFNAFISSAARTGNLAAIEQTRSGNLTIRATDSIELSGAFGGIGTDSLAGDAGDIVVETGTLRILNGSGISSDGQAYGAGGDIRITADSVSLSEFAPSPVPSRYATSSRISSTLNSTATGQPSNIIITTNSLSLRDGAAIRAESLGNSDSGNIRISARDQVEIIGSNSPEANPASTISSGTTLTATGAGGDINITVSNGQLRLLNGGQITASAGAGNGGDIEISANAVEVAGIAAFADNITGVRASSGISSPSVNGLGEPTVLGDAGNITIRTNQLSLREGGRINASTSGQGRGGDIRISPRDPNASSSVEISGVRPSTTLQVGSSLATDTSGANRAGDVIITTDRLVLRDGGRIAVDTTGSGRAGDIIINSADVELGGLGLGRFNSTISTASLRSNTATSAAESTGRAGNITITTDRLRLQDGAQLSSTAAGRGEGGTVRINVSEEIEIIGSGNTQFGTVASSIQSSALEDAQRAGNVIITTGRLTVGNGGAILANTSGAGRGGDIQINGNTITLDGTATGTNGILRSTLTSETSGAGRAGNIRLNTRELQILNGAGIFANTDSAGNGGNIRLQADLIDITGTARNNRNIISVVSTEASNRNATGNGGNIRIEGEQLLIRNRGAVSSGTAGGGNAGQILVRTREGIDLSQGLITSQVFAGGTGNSGDIQLETNTLNITDGGQIIAAVSRPRSDAQGNLLPGGRGQGGNITIRVSESIRISGIGTEGFSSGILTSTEREAKGRAGNITLYTDDFQIADAGIVTAGSFNDRPAGNITINANTFEAVDGGQVVTNARQAGNAGNIRLNINDNIRISGGYSDLENRLERINRYVQNNPSERPSDVLLIRETASGIFATTADRSQARGGTIEVSTNNLTLEDGARISAQSQGTGAAGGVAIQARDNVSLSNRAQISTESQGENARAGNIRVEVGNTFAATDSDVTTSAANASGGDIRLTARNIRLFEDSDIRTNSASNGGNITLNADTIVAFDDSDIFASAAEGRGGDITLNTPAFFGNNYQPNTLQNIDVDELENNNQVDLNATGNVSSGTISTPDTSFIQNSLADLPVNAIDPDSLIANSCIARTEDGSIFFITGSGGLPERPGDGATSTYPTGEVRAIPAEVNSQKPQSWHPGDPIVEPQAVYRLPDGRLVMSRECASPVNN